jgi:hypothetical protein
MPKNRGDSVEHTNEDSEKASSNQGVSPPASSGKSEQDPIAGAIDLMISRLRDIEFCVKLAPASTEQVSQQIKKKWFAGRGAQEFSRKSGWQDTNRDSCSSNQESNRYT